MTTEKGLFSIVETQIEFRKFFRAPYNSIYGPQESHIRELHNINSAMLAPQVGKIRP